MVDVAVQTQLIAQLDKLPLAKQQSVLEYARSVGGAPRKGVPGDRLLLFAGTFADEEAKEFFRASEDCRKVDEDEWSAARDTDLTWIREVGIRISEQCQNDPELLIEHYMEIQERHRDRLVYPRETDARDQYRPPNDAG